MVFHIFICIVTILLFTLKRQTNTKQRRVKVVEQKLEQLQNTQPTHLHVLEAGKISAQVPTSLCIL